MKTKKPWLCLDLDMGWGESGSKTRIPVPLRFRQHKNPESPPGCFPVQSPGQFKPSIKGDPVRDSQAPHGAGFPRQPLTCFDGQQTFLSHKLVTPGPQTVWAGSYSLQGHKCPHGDLPLSSESRLPPTACSKCTPTF